MFKINLFMKLQSMTLKMKVKVILDQWHLKII